MIRLQQRIYLCRKKSEATTTASQKIDYVCPGFDAYTVVFHLFHGSCRKYVDELAHCITVPHNVDGKTCSQAISRNLRQKL